MCERVLKGGITRRAKAPETGAAGDSPEWQTARTRPTAASKPWRSFHREGSLSQTPQSPMCYSYVYDLEYIGLLYSKYTSILGTYKLRYYSIN